MIKDKIGEIMYKWAEELWPITRSITGPGVRETLYYLKGLILNLDIHSISSGTPVFDWVVPDEWFIDEAYIIEVATGEKIVDFKRNKLHVLGYSEPIDKVITLDELKEHLYTQPDQPDAIPYVTSYYKRRWGFCISQNQKDNLKQGMYHVVIRSDLRKGELNYAELIIPGCSDKEVLISTYICHPSMANNELSGPVVVTAIARWLQSKSNLRYSYRIVFIPETIGSIVYLSMNLDTLKKKVIATY